MNLSDRLAADCSAVGRSINYLWRRITERSSMAAIGAAVLQAAVVPAPYSYVFIGFAAFQVLLPDGRVAKPAMAVETSNVG